MQLLYNAIACKEVDAQKLLLPGFFVGRDWTGIKVNTGDKIKVELAKETFLETTVQGIRSLIFDENMMHKLNLRVPSGHYFAIEVPPDFDEKSNTRKLRV